ncbi:hypothetical protein KY358_02275 [Candidatus Woesearchaeota archaeon]|nr:hypothetical protein [Candidatus Woesearchaeota archaeon]
MKRNVFIGILLISTLIILGCTNPTGKVVLRSPVATCKDVQVPYQATEYYLEREPYQAIEEYNVDLKYQVVESYHRGSISDPFNYKEKGIIRVKNVDSETGIFKVEMTFTTLDRGRKTLSSTKYIMSGETVEFNQYYDIDLGEDVNFNYRVIPGKKTLTRTVTKYRDIQKTRTVTKYKTEQKCD